MVSEPIFRSDRLNQLMDQREVNAGQLEYMSGISQSMIWLLQNEKRPNVSAVIAAKLAQALEVDVDFLLGLTDDPAPRRSKNILSEERATYTTDTLTDTQRIILEFFNSLDKDEQEFILGIIQFVQDRTNPRIIG